MWFVILCSCKESYEGKKSSICPHTGPVSEVSFFQGLEFAHTAEMQCSTMAACAMFTKCQWISNCVQLRICMSADKILKAHDNESSKREIRNYLCCQMSECS